MAAILDPTVTAYITQAAIARGIDPQVAIKVYQSEGAGGYIGDNGTSFGPFQLHYGVGTKNGYCQAGMGNDFTKATGLDARDRNTWKQQIDFALDQAKLKGWAPWYGARKAGIGNTEGLSQPVQATKADMTAAPSVAPPEHASDGLLNTASWAPIDKGLLGEKPVAPPATQSQSSGNLGGLGPTLLAIGAGLLQGNNWREGLGAGMGGAYKALRDQRELDMREKLLKAQLGPDIKTIKVGGQEVSAKVYPDGRMEPVDTSGLATTPQQYAIGDPKERATTEGTIRNQFQDQSKTFITVRDSYSKILQSAKEPSAAGDLALIFNYMRLLDPGSTVREGEFATAQNAAGVPERIQSAYNRVVSGERLAENQRADFVKQSKGLYSSQERQYKRVADQYKEIARRSGVNPENVVVDFGLVPDPEPAPPQVPAAAAPQQGLTTAGPNAVPLPSGHYVWNPQTRQLELQGQ